MIHDACRTFLIISLTTTLLVCENPGNASSDNPTEDQQATVKALFASTVNMPTKAENTQDLAQKLKHLEVVRQHLDIIIREHPNSDLAAKLTSDEAIGPIQYSAVTHAIDRLSQMNLPRPPTAEVPDTPPAPRRRS